MRKIFILFTSVLLTSISSLGMANYSEHPKAAKLIEQLTSSHGFSEAEVRNILSKAQTEQRILDSMANAAEKTKTWTAYRKSFLVPTRVNGGATFLQKYAGELAAAEQRYGVPRQVIAAIVGVETNYGGYTGKANVLNALATLAFEHPRRGKFFQSELLEFILLCREQGWAASERLGSYAGAMGISQFMPSNYRRLAVDGNGDGRIDLHNPVDAIHSVANYLVHHGWQAGAVVATRASVSRDFDASVIGKGLKPNYSVGELAQRGYFSQQSVQQDMRARVVRFNDEDGDEFWLGFDNFYSISRYNPRSKYAMAVYLLSEEILQAYAKKQLSRLRAVSIP
ncbi:MAG: lytic murein transglycosylase B [Gammaproteobacteria bacterium]|nr:lytic murein transglycosylase B [Gammaproteobacteria bacterium]NNM11699.1 lytic murein transglycosylase B [Pseudomonadales bacterium]